MIRDSLLLTVYNRTPKLLEDVLLRLLSCNLDNSEIVVIDDGSPINYTTVHLMIMDNPLGFRIKWKTIETLKDLPDTYNIDGLKNPANAWTQAVLASRGTRLWFVSSDCLVPPLALDRGREFLDAHPNAAYHARTLNSTGQVFCGYERPVPLGWFLGIARCQYEAIGGHDLGYMGGIAFEDADFAGRILRDVGLVGIDRNNDATVIHQDHPNVAYSDGGVGWRANESYTLKKWGGKIPFDSSKEAVPHYRELVGSYILLRPREASK